MSPWKEESPQHQGIKAVHDVPSLESRSNRMTTKDVSSNHPTTSHTNINDSCSKVVHAFGLKHFLQNLSEDKVEQIRKTMLLHEEMFKEQVKALHRLYNIQRSAMHEIRKHSFSPPNLSTFSTTTIHLHDDASKGLDIEGDLHRVSPYKQAENYANSHAKPRSPVRSMLRDENIAKSSDRSSLWDSEKNAINSAIKEKRARKTIDLERPPEEYLDDHDDFSENQETETRGAGKPDQASRNVSSTDNRLGSSENFSITTQMEEQFANQREWFRTDIGRHAERENCENAPLKRLKGSEDDTNLLTDLKHTIGQSTTAQSTSGTVMFLGKECNMDKQSSQCESSNNGQAHQGKKEKRPFDMELRDKPTDINTKLPPWFLQATGTGKRNPENDSSSQKTSWVLAPAPVFSQPQGWNFVGSSEDSLMPGKYPSSKDVKMLGTMPSIDKKNLNKEAQNSEDPGSRQENLMRHPKESFQSILASNLYGGANQLTPVVFTQGYPVGAAIPALGLQWSLEGHPALAGQGFVFPAVNKTSEAWAVPNPQGTYIQLYPYQQQVIHDHRFSAPCQSANQTSMQENGHIERYTPGKPISQAENATSLQAKTQQCHEESSSVNGPAGFPRSQHSSSTSPKPAFDIQTKLVENDGRTVGLTVDSRDFRTYNHSEGRISTMAGEVLGDPFKPFNTEEKRQIHAKVSRCSNHSLDKQEIEGQQEEEIGRNCKYELQTTEAIFTQPTTWSRVLVNESKTKDIDRSKSSQSGKGNCPLMEKRDTSHGECSAGQVVCQDSKELQNFANKDCLCNTPDIQKHASGKKLVTSFDIQGMQSQLSGLSNLEDTMSIDARHKLNWLSTDKSEVCASIILSQKENNKIEDLDSSGHGSNNIGTNEGKQCRGVDAQQLDPIDTYTSICSESKIAEDDEGQKQIETNGIQSRTEPVQIKEPDGSLADDKEQLIGVNFQTLTNMVLPHGRGEKNTSNSHAKIQGSPKSELGDVKKEECASGEKDMKNTRIDKLKHSDQIECLIDTQYSCTKKMPDLQSDHPITDRMSSKDKSSEATETHKGCSMNLQESGGGSEEEEEARESLAAKILLSLAPSKSHIKDMYKRSASITKESALQQQGQFSCIGPSSSHSSRDSTRHCNERRNSSRRNKLRTYEADDKSSESRWLPMYKFYKETWSFVGPDLLRVYNEFVQSHSLGSFINQGKIKFIPKIQAHATKVALDFSHLQELLDHWGSSPCMMSWVLPDHPLLHLGLLLSDDHLLMAHARGVAHTTTILLPRGCPSTSSSSGPGWTSSLWGKGVASTSQWGPPCHWPCRLFAQSPPPSWGIMVRLQMQYLDQDGLAGGPSILRA
ncbi:hypothetical protein KI387_019746 [Taxus chinensis]|uniref:Uncharacterized protein n=1 Tax=Taxus chinensis TaxID=29808 RepID=A0AA38LED7_TAXCH|nr:hypothetical protein KI387_019746 [Taxus chinensis]